MTPRMRSMICAAAFFAAAPLARPAAAKDAITTPEIVAASANFGCMAWRISGACFWLDCDLAGCSVKVSIKVSHRNPSLVVSAYDVVGENPWKEARALYGTSQRAAHGALYASLGVNMNRPAPGGKFVNNGNANREDTHFKSADVIGGPASAAMIASAFGLPLFCPMTDIAPLAPYFLSGLDALAWTSGASELVYPETWTPGLREIGPRTLANPLAPSWGPLFPRFGFLRTADDVKAGAVIAQRAADIVYKRGQPHVYARVGELAGAPNAGMRVWAPGELREHDRENSVWQMLVPKTDDDCDIFGLDDRFAAKAWSDGKFDKADYAFNLWRPYQCCEDRGIFLMSIDF